MSAALLSPGALSAGSVGVAIGFVLGRELRGGSVVDVLLATRALCPVLVAGGRHVLGGPVPVPGVDLRLLGVLLEVNGEVVATAAGAASLGHPAASVGVFAGAADGLRAGDVVVSAALVSVGGVRGGDIVVATVGRVGAVEAVVG